MKKAPIILAIISLFWVISLFLAPMLIESGTLKNLNAKANTIDNSEKWGKLSIYPKAVYYFGDLNCHQKSYRSYYINGNQMPMCARDVGIFIGVTLGVLTIFTSEVSLSFTNTFLSIFPIKLRKFYKKRVNNYAILLLLVLLCCLPLIFDGTIQLFTGYESTNLKRLITGMPVGWLGGYIFGYVLSA